MAAGASPGLTDLDRQRMREALALAEQSIGLSDPNPRVGCIVGWADGRIAGRGFTQQAGGPHAEVVALREAQAAGTDLSGATAWVTLEPCSHHGRTPPCCDALIAAGIGRVVVAVGDPNPLVAGAGLARLRAAGIEIAMGDDEVAKAARELNIGFFSRMERGRPWVRAKIAASLDGRTALPNGVSQWITGAAARRDGHAWRRRAGAIVTGSGTVLADDPRLDVRLVSTTMQPMRVVVDGSLRCPPSARIFLPPGQAIVVTADDTTHQANRLRSQGVAMLAMPDMASVPPEPAKPRVDLAATLSWLAGRGVNEVHVEAGAALNGALAQADLIDEWLVYLGPVWLGTGRGMLDLPPLHDLAQLPRWAFCEAVQISPDLRLRLRRASRQVSEKLTSTPGLG